MESTSQNRQRPDHGVRTLHAAGPLVRAPQSTKMTGILHTRLQKSTQCTNYLMPDYTCAENNHLARVTSGFRARGAATPAAQRAQPGPTPHPRRMPRATSFASWTEPASCDTRARRSKKRMPAPRRDDHTDENMDSE